MKSSLKDFLYGVLLIWFGIMVGKTIYKYQTKYDNPLYYLQAMVDIKDGQAVIRDSCLILYPNRSDTIIKIIIPKEQIFYEK